MLRIVLTVVPMALLLNPMVGQAGEGQPAAQPQASQTKIIVSKETTRVTGPLKADGTVDYVAALNEILGEGVTPENNASVLYWRASGPGALAAELRERYFKMLGMEPLPEQGEYFIGLSEFAVRRAAEEKAQPGEEKGAEAPDETKIGDAAWSDCEEASRGPWSAEAYPVLAAWLAANEKPLALFSEGARRERWYSPLVASGAEPAALVSVLLPQVQSVREVVRAFSLRALLRLGAGQVDRAWEDVMTCHRISRHIGQGSTLIEALVSFAIEGVAHQADVAVAHHGRLTAEQAAKYRADLAALGRIPHIAHKLDLAERFMFLDTVTSLSRHRSEEFFQTLTILAAVASVPSGDAVKTALRHPLIQASVDWVVDWNAVLRRGNAFYDRLVMALMAPDPAERQAAMAQLEDEIKQAAAHRFAPADLLKQAWMGNSPRQIVTDQLVNTLIALLTPAIMTTTAAEDRVAAQGKLSQLALALAGYKGKHGRYPKNLTDLTPTFLAEAPEDSLAEDKKFRYRASESGYVLYSVGPNREDDGGRTVESEPRGDDLVVQTGAAD